jgi:hypothetical protein
VRTLTVDNLEVRRLHVGELIIDSGVPDRGRGEEFLDSHLKQGAAPEPAT